MGRVKDEESYIARLEAEKKYYGEFSSQLD